MVASLAKSQAVACLGLILRPLARFCLRRSLKLQDAYEQLKIAFIEAAREELVSKAELATTNKISVMSGVHRKDVDRLSAGQIKDFSETHVVGKIVGQWQSDKRFCTRGGKPKVLSCEGKSSEFADLVRIVTLDLNPYTALFELERSGTVERTSKGVKLATPIYFPNDSLENGFSHLAGDIGYLLNGVEENILEQQDPPNLHITTSYDNIPPEREAEIRNWILDKGSAFHAELRAYLSRLDRDINKTLPQNGGRIRVSVGAFGKVDQIPQPQAEEPTA